MASPNYRFSEHFAIKSTEDDDWFDVLLPVDTQLFVDPFRVYTETSAPWAGSHDHLLAFFQLIMELVARSHGDTASAHWRAAERLLRFPEPAEFCLGYGDTPLGQGTGDGIGTVMIEAAQTTIELGAKDVEHFEEMLLFREGVGPDRISDAVCNVLKSHFIAYTESVCVRHPSIETQEITIEHASWSESAKRWEDRAHRLPQNPYTGRAILLVPRRFLRRLPTVDPSEFWNYAWENAADTITAEFNYDVATNVDGKEIARLARAHPNIARNYLKDLEQHPKEPYDLDADRNGEVSWYDTGLHIAETLPPRQPPPGEDDFCDFIEQLLIDFKQIVEQRGSWKLLWNGSRGRSEKHAQQLFLTAMIGYCKSHDIDLAAESNAGRGPVDFKFSRGWHRRALVEIKLSRNSSYWHGIEKQTPIYMMSEEIGCGYFLTIQYTDEDLGNDRIKRVEAKARDVSKTRGYRVKPIFVNARQDKPSASKS